MYQITKLFVFLLFFTVVGCSASIEPKVEKNPTKYYRIVVTDVDSTKTISKITTL